MTPTGGFGALPDRCVTVTVDPPMITMATRASPVVFAAARMVSVPPPLPELPLGNVIHCALDVALHVHPAPAVIVIDSSDPLKCGLTLVGRAVTVHADPACWLTVTAVPAIVSVAERGEEVVFAEMFSPTVPPPEPLELFSVIHGTEL